MRKARQNFFQARYIAAFSFILVALTGYGYIAYHMVVRTSYSAGLATSGPDDGPNQPFGKAQGVNPGRVVWIWNPEATNENCTTVFETKDWYWKPENTNGKVVGSMFRKALFRLTDKATVARIVGCSVSLSQS